MLALTVIFAFVIAVTTIVIIIPWERAQEKQRND